MARMQRLNKVLRELNIPLDRAVEFLTSKDINIDARPTTKISEEVFELLCKEFKYFKKSKPNFIIELEELLDYNAGEVTLSEIGRVDFNKNFKYTLNDKEELIGLRISRILINEIIINEITIHKNTLKALCLFDNQLRDIRFLEDFKKLNSIFLWENEIIDIEVLKKLPNLKNIDLWHNEIANIDALKNLTQLTYLDLSANLISDVSALKNLIQLRLLYLGDNDINNIKPINNLTNLTKISLSDNQITNINLLKNHPNLTRLYLSGNQISNIDVLKNLTSLTNLRLDKNQITNIDALKNLTNLTNLRLDKNQITNIDILKNLNKLSNLLINNNPIAEIIKIDTIINTKDQLKIVKSWLSLENKTEKEIKLPTKILLLGNSKIGKTCLRLFLKGEEPCVKHDSTHILEVFDWEYEKEKTATIWDFGGQDYYHSVHHLFFTLSSLYIILYDDVTNKNEFLKTENYYNFNLNYWLENIHYITPDIKNKENKAENQSKKIMLVENKIDTNDNVIEISPKHQIKDKYRISLCPKEKEESFTTKQDFLKSEIIHELNKLKNETVLNISTVFDEVVEQIKKGTFGKKDRYHYSKKYFLTLCKKVNPKIVTSGLPYLLNSLQNAGLIFYFSEMPNDVWLYPNKLIQKIHDILNEKSLKRWKGKLVKSQLDKLEKDNLLNLLLEQEIIFEDKDTNKYIFPQYLPVSEENNVLYEIAKTNLHPAFSLKFEHFLPSAFMSRVICRFGKQENTSIAQKFYSRYEIIFTEEINNEKIRVWIKTDLAKLQVEVFISDIKNKKYKEQYLNYLFKALLVAYDGKAEHLNFIDYIKMSRSYINQYPFYSKRKKIVSSYFDRISFGKTTRIKIIAFNNSIWSNITEYIPDDLNLIVNNFKVKYSTLEKLEQKDKFVTTTENKTIHNNIFNAFIPLELKAPMKLFISYSHKDYNYLERLETHLAGLRRDGLIEDWNDTKFRLGDHWNDKIKDKLREADIVILLISADFINSSYINDVELPIIKEIEGNNSSVVFPVIVESCDWETQKWVSKIQSGLYKVKGDDGLKDDKKELVMLPIEQWKYPSEAYTLITKKIREYVNQYS